MEQHIQRRIRLAALALAWVCLFVMLAPAGVGAETVKAANWDKLVAAVDAGATDISLTRNFQQNLDSGAELVLRDGRVITLHTPSGKPVEITASFTVRGENGGGTLILDQIDLQAPANHPALRVTGEGATVQAGDLTGGKSTAGSPFPVLIAENDARVSAKQIIAADGANVGGDGILAIGHAQIEADTVIAGDSKSGYGGTAICAVGDATVTLTGNATGGSGLFAPGWALRSAGNATVTVQGNATDGTQYNSQRPATVPEEANNLAALRYMVLRGDKEITLAPSFQYTAKEMISPRYFCDQYWFAPDQEIVRISTSEKAKRNAVFGGTHHFVSGNFVLSSIDLVSRADGILVESGAGDIGWTGKFTTNAVDADTVTVKGGSLTLSGNLSQESKKGGAALTVSGKDAKVNVYGNITGASMTADTVIMTDGAATLNGNISQKGTTDGSAIRVSGESALLNVFGNIDTASPQPAVKVTDAEANVTGNITAKASSALSASGSAKVRITGDLTNDGGKTRSKPTLSPCAEATDLADCLINGAVLSKAGPAVYAEGSSQLSVIGKVTATNNNAVEENGSANVTVNGTLQCEKGNYYMVYLHGAGNVIVLTPPGAATGGSWYTGGAGGNLILCSGNLSTLSDLQLLPRDEGAEQADEALPEALPEETEPELDPDAEEVIVPEAEPTEDQPAEETATPAPVEETPAVPEETPAPVEETPAAPVATPTPVEETPVIPEATPTPVEEATATPEPTPEPTPEATPTAKPTPIPAETNSTGMTYADVARLYGWDPDEAAAAGLNFIYVDYDESGHEIMTTFKPE